MKQHDYNEDTQREAIDIARELRAKIKEHCEGKTDSGDPEVDAAMVCTYTLNALLVVAYELAAHYGVPSHVLLRAMEINYESFAPSLSDGEQIH